MPAAAGSGRRGLGAAGGGVAGVPRPLARGVRARVLAAAARRRALLAQLCWVGHGTASPVAHAGGMPLGQRPANSTAKAPSQKR